MGGMWVVWIETYGWFLLIRSDQVTVGHSGQTGFLTVAITVLFQSLDRTNIQAMVRNTICIRSSPTTLPRHSTWRMKGKLWIWLQSIPQRWERPPYNIQYSTQRPKPWLWLQSIPHSEEMIFTHHLVWRMKGEVMAMTTDCIIQLLTSLPPRSVMPMNSQATTLTTIRIIVSQTILLRLFVHMWPYVIGRRKNTKNSLRKRLDRAKLIICKSLRKITASIVHNGMRFITSTLVRHLVRVGPTADLMRWTLSRTTNNLWRSLQKQYKTCNHTNVGILQRLILYFGEEFL